MGLELATAAKGDDFPLVSLLKQVTDGDGDVTLQLISSEYNNQIVPAFERLEYFILELNAQLEETGQPEKRFTKAGPSWEFELLVQAGVLTYKQNPHSINEIAPMMLLMAHAKTNPKELRNAILIRYKDLYGPP